MFVYNSLHVCIGHIAAILFCSSISLQNHDVAPYKMKNIYKRTIVGYEQRNVFQVEEYYIYITLINTVS